MLAKVIVKYDMCLFIHDVGPKLPKDLEDRRITYKVSETGNKSMDDTVLSIRDKVKRVSIRDWI